ncbi:sugar kinase [Glaciecola siphonariae]|uniref:Sugar kinase n=1 Tax=Glaciecola siphonariae TaxID=521012 RepID=A0ABV9LW86_9ALTE
MNKIFFLGECMIELRRTDKTNMRQSFAGDVFNSAVYLKRCFNKVSCAMVTALGEDKLSTEMVEAFEQAGLDTGLVFRHPHKNAGLYAIETDDKGERSFTYWRSDSAARTLARFLDKKVLSAFKAGDLLFFSGISLAVIAPQDREVFWQKLSALKDAGAVLVFDPNYRARMWQSTDEAKYAFDKAFSMAQIALPGVEDLSALYGINDARGVIEYCQSHDIKEVVVKDGPNSVLSLSQGHIEHHTIVPNQNVVDTTSAGDAFNGVYLGARMNDLDIDKSIALAAKAASIVIQHSGAIAPKEAFTDGMSPLLSSE